MTEADVMRIAIGYAKDRDLMLNSPRPCTDEGFGRMRSMSFWGISKVFPDKKVVSSFAYDPQRLEEKGYEEEFRINCQAALFSLDQCEADGLLTGQPQG